MSQPQCSPFMPQSLRRQKGNALVFSMLGLVIGGIVLALGISYYQNAQTNAQVQGTISEISAIIGGAQQNYGQYGYAGLTTAVAVGSRVIPDTRADEYSPPLQPHAAHRYTSWPDLKGDRHGSPDAAQESIAAIPCRERSVRGR